MSKSVAEILDAAADLIEPEGAWTQDYFAHDAWGREVEPNSPLAVCFCARGAVYRVSSYVIADDSENARLFAPLVQVLGAESFRDIETWNDELGRTQAEVVAKLREAAAKAREQGL